MKTLAHRGFTIIEVMLFLAISGLLAVMLLSGWTLMINTQRYKDSIDTVYGYVQDQYNLVYNVENERSSALACIGGKVTDAAGGSTETRGQSECVLMGRYIKLTNGTTFQSYAVVGREPATGVTGSDTEQIKAYGPTVVIQSIGLTENKQIVPWGAVLKRPGSADSMSATILLLRSPKTGTVHRYIVNGTPVEPIINLDDIRAENESTDTKFCFDPGGPIQGSRQAVQIGKYASSRNSVETLAEGSNGC